MRISDWSSYVCSSVLSRTRRDGSAPGLELPGPSQNRYRSLLTKKFSGKRWPGHLINHYSHRPMFVPPPENDPDQRCPWTLSTSRSEEHTSELQSLMRISYAVFCLNNTKQK